MVNGRSHRNLITRPSVYHPMGRAPAYALCSKRREPAGTMPFNARRCIFPVSPFGNRVTKRIRSGTLQTARICRACSHSACDIWVIAGTVCERCSSRSPGSPPAGLRPLRATPWMCVSPAQGRTIRPDSLRKMCQRRFAEAQHLPRVPRDTGKPGGLQPWIQGRRN